MKQQGISNVQLTSICHRSISYHGSLPLHWNPCTVREDELPTARSFFEEGRFKPILFCRTRIVGDGSFVNVGNQPVFPLT